jgi:preprotein translocase subunit SecD
MGAYASSLLAGRKPVTKPIATIVLGAASLGLIAQPAGGQDKDTSHHLRFRPVLAELPVPTNAATTQGDQINAILESCPTDPESAVAAIAQVDLATVPSSPAANDTEGACVVLPVTPENPNQQTRYLVGPAVLTERNVVAAKDRFVKGRGWVIDVLLRKSGRNNLNRLAKESFGKPPPQNSAAIVLDGGVLSAPRFNEASFGRLVEICCGFSKKEAADLTASITLAARKS